MARGGKQGGGHIGTWYNQWALLAREVGNAGNSITVANADDVKPKNQAKELLAKLNATFETDFAAREPYS